MKRYKLLKDLPCAMAGEILEINRGGIGDYITLYRGGEQIHQFKVSTIISTNFDEWFEEIQELKKYYYIGSMGHVESAEYKGWEVSLKLRKSIGNYFETEEEAEKYLEYLKSKEVIKKDAKGFKPDWKNKTQAKYFGCWDSLMERKRFDYEYTFKNSEIYFQSEEDIKESFEKHPEEWKAYLLYNQ